MNFNNIFTNSSKQTLSQRKSAVSLSYEHDTVDATLEVLAFINQECFNISKEHSYAVYVGSISRNSEILTEGFKDAIESAIRFFKNLIAKIGEFFKKAFTFISSYIGDFEKFINKNKDVLKNLDPDFEVETFIYTFEKSIPNTTQINSIVHSYNSEVSSIDDVDPVKLRKDHEDFISSSNLDKLRAEVIGESGGIAEEHYLERVKGAFRNGRENPEKINVNKSVLNKTMNDYSTLKKKLNDTKKEQANIVNILNSMKRFFETNPYVRYSGSSKVADIPTLSLSDTSVRPGEKKQVGYSYDKITVLNSFFKFKFEESQALSVMLTNAYFEKIKALKEALKSYKHIIRSALFSANKESNDKIKA